MGAFFDLPDVKGDLTSIAQRFGVPVDVITGALNSFGIPNTRVRLSHAYTLRTKRNQVIGGVYEVGVDQGRDIQLKAEVNVNAHGEFVDIVPGLMSTQTISIAIYDLYERVMEEALGTREIVVLTDQRTGLKLREVWRAPTGILGSDQRRYSYGPLFFSRLGRRVATTDDRVVRVNAELVWLDRERIE